MFCKVFRLAFYFLDEIDSRVHTVQGDSVTVSSASALLTFAHSIKGRMTEPCVAAGLPRSLTKTSLLD